MCHSYRGWHPPSSWVADEGAGAMLGSAKRGHEWSFLPKATWDMAGLVVMGCSPPSRDAQSSAGLQNILLLCPLGREHQTDKAGLRIPNLCSWESPQGWRALLARQRASALLPGQDNTHSSWAGPGRPEKADGGMAELLLPLQAAMYRHSSQPGKG